MTDQSPEQVKALQDQQMREAFMQSFHQFYGQLAQFLNKIPLNQKLKDFSLMNFDQGAMWAREAIASMQFGFQEPTTPVAPVAEDKSSEVPAEVKQEVQETVAVTDEAKTEAEAA